MSTAIPFISTYRYVVSIGYRNTAFAKFAEGISN
jgi:hypothetical protein